MTDGGRPCTDGGPEGCLSLAPPEVAVTRVTGAGDTFMAAHIAAEIRGAGRAEALQCALASAADYVSTALG